MVILTMPFICAFAGECVAWRVGEWIRFPFSNAAFVPASYPIVDMHSGRSRKVFGIDPFDVGWTTDFEVPPEQFEAYKAHAGHYCITVMQRRSAEGAVEILDPGINRNPPPAKLTPCPSHRVRARLGQ